MHDFRGYIGHVLGPGEIGEDHIELVAADAGKGIGPPDVRPEPGPDLFEQLIADLVAQRVVDLLETIEIKKKDCQFLLVPLRLRKLDCDDFLEKASVGQVGQRVVVRHMSDLLLQPLPLGDIPNDTYCVPFVFKLKCRQGKLYGEFRAAFSYCFYFVCRSNERPFAGCPEIFKTFRRSRIYTDWA